MNAEMLGVGPVQAMAPLLNMIGVAVFVVGVRGDDEFEVEFLNSYYEKIFNVRSVDCEGRQIRDLLAEEDADAVLANYRRCVLSAQIEQYDEAINLPGGTFFARTTLTPLMHEGRVVRLMGTSVDISDRKALELNLGIARDRAEVANKAKSEFLANMSHELRTPLNAVIGFADMLHSEVFGPLGNDRYKGYVNDIVFAGRHLLGVIGDILDLSKMESGQTDLQETVFRVGELLEDAARISNTNPQGKGATIRTGRVFEDVRLRADSKLLRQALINVASNAWKSMDEDPDLQLGAELLDDGRLALVIADMGQGMRAIDLPVALAPFGRIGDSMSSRSTGGAGLGLPITRALIERHGGELHINTQVGIGTTVYLVLPADRVILPGDMTIRDMVTSLQDFFTIDGVNLPEEALKGGEGVLDRLAVGAIQLDARGKILQYNATEAEFTEMRAERVIGRDFFREVAPCTFTDVFHGRFQAVLNGRSKTEVFSYTFTLRTPWKVLIEMRAGVEPDTVWLFIRWI
jgi:photoactive yellow protein